MAKADVGRRSDVQTMYTGWVGWVVFASVMMMLLGASHALAGLVALMKDDYYLVRSDGLVLEVSYTTWGWVHLILGIVVVIAGVALLRGATWARALTVVVAGLSVIANLAFLQANPLWSAIMVALSILVIYAVTAHGGEAREA
jgi:hypothetical protein